MTEPMDVRPACRGSRAKLVRFFGEQIPPTRDEAVAARTYIVVAALEEAAIEWDRIHALPPPRSVRC